MAMRVRTSALSIVMMMMTLTALAAVAHIPSRCSALGTTHTPITINGDAEFTAANGVVSGSGSESDPYIIMGWDIDAHDGEYAISISNTDSHAVIRGCVLYNASTNTLPNSHALKLQNVKNLTVEDNLVFDAYTAIFMEDSDNNIIRGNTLNNTVHTGLQLYANNDENLIENNTIHDIGYNGICLWLGSDNNTVTGNWVHSNTFAAVQAIEADGNVVTYNVLEDSQTGIEVYYSFVRNMTVEGNTIQNCNAGVTVSGDGHLIRGNFVKDNTWGVDLYKCNNSVVDANTIERTTYGVWIREGRDNNVTSNLIRDCFDVGAMLEGAERCTLKNNIFENNSGYGVYIDSLSSSNLVYLNSFWYNAESSGTFDDTCVQAYDDGSNNLWNSSGRGNFWSDWRSPDNDTDGIVDLPYEIDGEAMAQDLHPLTSPPYTIPELGVLGYAGAALLSLIVIIAIGASARRRRSPQTDPVKGVIDGWSDTEPRMKN